MVASEVKSTKTYYDVKASSKRFNICQGGSRSGKTYSILQFIVELCARNQDTGATVTIARRSFPTLRRTVMKDFFEILGNFNLYNAKYHSKTNHTYLLFGNIIQFVALDDPQKLRGLKQDVLYINEANEISWESFLQLNQRTTKRCIIDFNPSEEYWESHLRNWEEYRNDTDYFKSTFLDNPFLPEIQVKQILAYQTTDPFRWAVYGLGEFSIKEGIIYRAATQVFTPFPVAAKKRAFGLDFGYTNDPTALVECGVFRGELHVKQHIYETNLTNTDIINKLKALNVSKLDEIYADSAEPKSIEEIKRAGFNIRATIKGADSINNGISLVKEYKLIVVDSPDIWKERNNYEWKKDANDKNLNRPVDNWNHALDAIRYYATMKLKKGGLTMLQGL